MIFSKINKLGSVLVRWSNIIYPRPKYFGQDKVERRERYKYDYHILADSLISHLEFRNMLDVGCAQGLLMRPFHERGIDVQGVEISDVAVEYLPESLKPRVKIGDFSKASGTYDLVCCIEVAEHINPTRSQELVNKLCALSNRYIFFSAAPLGQGGHGHINCRPHSQWIQWFNQSGYHVSHSITKQIRSDLEEVQHTYWLKRNVFILDCK